MIVPPRTSRPELKFRICTLSATVNPFNTLSGTVVPKKFRSSVFLVSNAPRMVKLLTVIEPGKFTGVDALMDTAFQPEFVIMTACELSGRIPKDQFEGTSQLPLPATHEFTMPPGEPAPSGTTSPVARIRA